MSSFRIAANVVVVARLLNSDRAADWGVGIRVIVAGSELGGIIVDADEAASTDLETTTCLRFVPGAGVVASRLVVLVDVGWRQVAAVALCLVLGPGESEAFGSTKRLTSVVGILRIDILLTGQQSASRFDLMIAPEVVVHCRSVGISGPNLPGDDSSLDFDFMNTKVEIVRIQRPGVGQDLVGNVRLLSVGDEKNRGVGALIDGNILRLVKGIGILGAKDTGGWLALGDLKA